MENITSFIVAIVSVLLGLYSGFYFRRKLEESKKSQAL